MYPGTIDIANYINKFVAVEVKPLLLKYYVVKITLKISLLHRQ